MVALRRRTFFFAVGGAAVYGVATVASAWVVGWVTDNVILPRFDEGHVAAGSVATGIALIIAVAVVKVAGVLCRRINATITAARVGATLRSHVVEQYQQVPYEYHQRNPTGELLAHAGADIDAATDVLSPLPFATGVIVILVVATLWMVFTDPWLALIGLTLFPTLIILNVVYQRKVEVPAEFAQAQIGVVSAVAHESFDGALVVKALGAEDLEGHRFRNASEILRDAKIRVAVMRATLDAVLDSLPSIAVVVLVVVGAWQVQRGEITTGSVVSFVALLNLIVWPLRLIGFVLGDLPRAVVSHDRIASVFAEPTDPRNALVAATVPPPSAPAAALAVAVRDISFEYENGRPVLEHVSFTVTPGRTVAIVGPTGCGKSTLVLLLAGLLPPRSGTIAYDDRDLESLSVSELRADTAIAFQEPFLFAESVRENILLGLDVDESELDEATALAGASRFVARLNAGIDTVVGERGATLSGGQRQRVALARALVRKPRLLLLDDATSSVDPSTEARILAGLSERLSATTTVVVANRPSTIALADEVVYLEDGRLVAQGTHPELLAAYPGYERLVRAYDLDRAERAS
jgi:ABC-type multidrug transport system fused ATPase/permease subunit